MHVENEAILSQLWVKLMLIIFSLVSLLGFYCASTARSFAPILIFLSKPNGSTLCQKNVSQSQLDSFFSYHLSQPHWLNIFVTYHESEECWLKICVTTSWVRGESESKPWVEHNPASDHTSKPLILLKGVCLLHLLSENIFPVLRSNWFYVFMKQKLIWNLSLCYFSLFCFYLSGYDARTAERKSDSTWSTWYKQTARVYHSRRPISWLIPEMQYPVIYIIKFSNN